MCMIAGCVLRARGQPGSSCMCQIGRGVGDLQCAVAEEVKSAGLEVKTDNVPNPAGEQHLWPCPGEEQRIRQMQLFQHIMRVRFDFEVWTWREK
jgi:hypothetical protein